MQGNRGLKTPDKRLKLSSSNCKILLSFLLSTPTPFVDRKKITHSPTQTGVLFRHLNVFLAQLRCESDTKQFSPFCYIFADLCEETSNLIVLWIWKIGLLFLDRWIKSGIQLKKLNLVIIFLCERKSECERYFTLDFQFDLNNISEVFAYKQ